MADSSITSSVHGSTARPRRVVTETWFFPLAALHGALIVALFVLGLAGLRVAPPGLTTPAGHAHELLFGYALAVTTGFLVQRMSPGRLLALVLLWLSARAAFLWLPGTLVSAMTNAGFAIALAVTAAPRFMKSAKKWRNRLTGPLILAICLAVLAFQLLNLRGGGFQLYVVLGEAVVLFSLLMLFFGGRLIAPAAAGAIEQAGDELAARVQPRVEGSAMLVMVAAAATAPWPAAAPLHGALLAAAGGLVLLRLLRWRLWSCSHRPDLICLGVGYGWLGVGLVLLGAARGFDIGLAPSAATHAITVGALGTLTTNIMLRTRLLRLRVAPVDRTAWLAALTAAIATAALARILGAGNLAWLLFAAACWSAAMLLLLVLLLIDREPARSRAMATGGMT